MDLSSQYTLSPHFQHTLTPPSHREPSPDSWRLGALVTKEGLPLHVNTHTFMGVSKVPNEYKRTHERCTWGEVLFTKVWTDLRELMRDGKVPRDQQQWELLPPWTWRGEGDCTDAEERCGCRRASLDRNCSHHQQQQHKGHYRHTHWTSEKLGDWETPGVWVCGGVGGSRNQSQGLPVTGGGGIWERTPWDRTKTWGNEERRGRWLRKSWGVRSQMLYLQERRESLGRQELTEALKVAPGKRRLQVESSWSQVVSERQSGYGYTGKSNSFVREVWAPEQRSLGDSSWPHPFSPQESPANVWEIPLQIWTYDSWWPPICHEYQVFMNDRVAFSLPTQC